MWNGVGVNRPSVSVVVPAHNAESTIERCVESLLGQDYPQARCQVLIVDNNGTDRTSQLVAAYPVTLLHERRTQSAYAARNLGIQHATGDYIAFTDADCVADASWLNNLLADWQDPTIGCFSGLIKAYEPDSAVAELLAKYQAERFYGQGQAVLPYAVGGNAAYPRSVLQRIGLFDATLRSGGDLELSLRMQKQTDLRISFVERAVVYHTYPSTIAEVFWTSHFRGYGQGMVNEKYHQRGPLRQYVRRNLQTVLSHGYYFIRTRLTNPWRRRSPVETLDSGLRVVIRLGAVTGHLHHAADKARGRVRTSGVVRSVTDVWYLDGRRSHAITIS
jgi:glycosyltransferase involved in cell wall biosynthesis